MMKLTLSNGEKAVVAYWQTAEEAVRKAIEYAARWHFNAGRNLDNDMIMMRYGSERFYFQRSEGWGVGADIHLNIYCAARFPELPDLDPEEKGEPLRLLAAYVEVNWSSTTHNPSRALAAANVHKAAAECACGMIPFMYGHSGPMVWPSRGLTSEEETKLEELLVDKIGDTV